MNSFPSPVISKKLLQNSFVIIKTKLFIQYWISSNFEQLLEQKPIIRMPMSMETSPIHVSETNMSW